MKLEDKYPPELVDYSLNRGVGVEELDEIINKLTRAVHDFYKGDNNKIKVFQSLKVSPDDFIIKDETVSIERKYVDYISLFKEIIKQLKKLHNFIDKHIIVMSLLGSRVSANILALATKEDCQCEVEAW